MQFGDGQNVYLCADKVRKCKIHDIITDCIKSAKFTHCKTKYEKHVKSCQLISYMEIDASSGNQWGIYYTNNTVKQVLYRPELQRQRTVLKTWTVLWWYCSSYTRMGCSLWASNIDESKCPLNFELPHSPCLLFTQGFMYDNTALV